MVDSTSANPPATLSNRPIRSFVLRQGRISVAQEKAYAEWFARYSAPFQPELLDTEALFARKAPLIVEIGFGMGETTAILAAQHPENNYLGLEVHTPGIGALLKNIRAQNLENIRIIQHDAVEVVKTMLPPASVAGFHIFFPDPWPKKRHHKRRLLQARFIHELALRLAPNGYLHIATDWEDYAMATLEICQTEALLRNTVPSGFAPRPTSRPFTKFERRGLRLGHNSWDILFCRQP